MKHTLDLPVPGLHSSVDSHVLLGQGLSSLTQGCRTQTHLCTIRPSLSPATPAGSASRHVRWLYLLSISPCPPHPCLTRPRHSPGSGSRLHRCDPLPGISPLPRSGAVYNPGLLSAHLVTAFRRIMVAHCVLCQLPLVCRDFLEGRANLQPAEGPMHRKSQA